MLVARGGELQRQYTRAYAWRSNQLPVTCSGYVEPMLAAQHELIQPICGGALEAPVAEPLKGHDSIGGVWGVWRPGYFLAAPGAALPAALGPLHTRLDVWFCRWLHMHMVCSS